MLSCVSQIRESPDCKLPAERVNEIRRTNALWPHLAAAATKFVETIPSLLHRSPQQSTNTSEQRSCAPCRRLGDLVFTTSGLTPDCFSLAWYFTALCVLNDRIDDEDVTVGHTIQCDH